MFLRIGNSRYMHSYRLLLNSMHGIYFNIGNISVTAGSGNCAWGVVNRNGIIVRNPKVQNCVAKCGSLRGLVCICDSDIGPVAGGGVLRGAEALGGIVFIAVGKNKSLGINLLVRICCPIPARFPGPGWGYVIIIPGDQRWWSALSFCAG